MGFRLNPGTDLETILPFLDQVDLVLIHECAARFRGAVLQHRWRWTRSPPWPVAREAEGLEFLINVDGGINDETGMVCRQAGADILVSGSWLVGAEDRAQRVIQLRG